ncbi:carboxylate-amine ligase [Actinospica robiniae]|uniref:carboxylate-amine ligase n=1 Tax=Actinospica robiniae TaxID=304901 RepID=UPI00040FE870|nr:YbdK family carboxylate-amine ligase [Actinospica robiniae]
MVEQVFGRDRLTFGVEEEFLLVDAETRVAAARSDQVIAQARLELGDQIESEFYLSQLETHSEPCGTAAELRRDLARCRRVAARAARDARCLLVASPCAVLTSRPLPIRSYGRYLRLAEHLGPVLVKADCEISGLHVHLGSLGRGESLALSAALRPWLPVLQALAANAPFAAEADTGWASRRGLTYGRWPTVGPAPVLDERGYDKTVAELISTGIIIDPAMLYWYARPSAHYPTLETRVADVNGDLDTTVLLAVLLRGLATVILAGLEQRLDHRPGAGKIDDDRLVENHYRAARYGMAARLFDSATGQDQPVPALLDALLEFAEPALDALGDLPFAVSTLHRLLRDGGGAERQRAEYARTGSWTGLVDYLARETIALSDDEARSPVR